MLARYSIVRGAAASSLPIPRLTSAGAASNVVFDAGYYFVKTDKPQLVVRPVKRDDGEPERGETSADLHVHHVR